MTATKNQLIDFIIEKFEGPEHEEVSRSKLDAYKKADLEAFIKEKSLESDFEKWLLSSH